MFDPNQDRPLMQRFRTGRFTKCAVWPGGLYWGTTRLRYYDNIPYCPWRNPRYKIPGERLTRVTFSTPLIVCSISKLTVLNKLTKTFPVINSAPLFKSGLNMCHTLLTIRIFLWYQPVLVGFVALCNYLWLRPENDEARQTSSTHLLSGTEAITYEFSGTDELMNCYPANCIPYICPCNYFKIYGE